MAYVANARMYSVAPAAAAAWKDLFAWLARESGVDLDVIDHAFPLPLGDLWGRTDLACAFMCGFPFVLSSQKLKPVMAPVPRGGPKPGQACYATHLIVHREAAFQTLEDTFGHRLGYTVEDSHSGYNALRHHLLPYWRRNGGPLYRESVGPMYTPRRVIEAVAAGRIDVGPLDSYAFELMRLHDPDFVDQVRIIDTTDTAPIPFFVASPTCPDPIVAALQAALAQFGDDNRCAQFRDRLFLAGFAPVATADHGMIAQWDREARAAGYRHPG